MVYRCLSCDHCETRGFIPGATSGLCLFGVLGCVAFLLPFGAGVVTLTLRVLLGEGVIDAEPRPWWLAYLVWPVIGASLCITGWYAVNFLLELTEYLAYARRPCPECGGRRWSWGSTAASGCDARTGPADLLGAAGHLLANPR